MFWPWFSVNRGHSGANAAFQCVLATESWAGPQQHSSETGEGTFGEQGHSLLSMLCAVCSGSLHGSLPPWVPCASRGLLFACFHVPGTHRGGVRPHSPLGELDCISTFGSGTASWSVFVSGLWKGDYPLAILFPSQAPSSLLQLLK